MEGSILNGMFTLQWMDVVRGIAVAILGGAFLAIIGVIGSVGFDVFSADWNNIFHLAVNGAFGGFVGYLSKNFFTADNGKILKVL